MPWTPKSAAPQCQNVTPLCTFDCATTGGVTLFIAAPGFLPANSLAAALQASERRMLWLRLGAEDRDPAALLVSLIAGMQRLQGGAGRATLEQMRRQPGPTAGWPSLFGQLAQELAELLGSTGALVIEHCHYLGDACQALRLLGAHMLSALPASLSCVLTSERPLPASALPARTVQQDAGALRLSAQAARRLADQHGCSLSSSCIGDLIALADGRAAVLADLCAAAEVLGPAPIQLAVARASRLEELLTRIAHAWVSILQTDAQRALALALRVDYAHPALLRESLNTTNLPAGPWFEQLDGEWLYVQPIWRSALRAALQARTKLDQEVLRRAAGYLAAQGAIEQAVPLYFDFGAWTHAAEVIASAADTLMDIGQWETLDDWLSQLPARALEEWPWLVYIAGELAAIQGLMSPAQRAFALASKIFIARHEAHGACQSLLAESTLAEWHGDWSRAQSYALTASTLAENHDLPWYQSWAAWQLGRLAAAADDVEGALLYFATAETAASSCDDAHMFELPRQAERLALQRRELYRQREFHRLAYFAAEQAEQSAAEQLNALLSSPPIGIDALLECHGWVHVPLMLKLPGRGSSTAHSAITIQEGIMARLLNKLGLRRQPSGSAATAHCRTHAAALPAFSSPAASQLADLCVEERRSSSVVDNRAHPAAAGELVAPACIGDEAIAIGAAHFPGDRALGLSGWHSQPAPAASGAAIAESTPHLTVYMLGSFRVALNDHTIESWPSARGRSVLKYLLTQRDRPVARDVLMDTFWPDATPEAARNSLNVALHGLRQALRTADEMQVIIFENGAYRLNPQLSIWIDVEEFERSLQAAHRLEAAGQLAAAVGEYEAAISLYQDDFFVDDPYEEWPVLARERLRVMLLEALDRLSQIFFGRGEYTACIGLCQRILARDNCREDAHCRLIRCHSRQNQHNLALRQYQICVETLRTELDIEPAPATTALYERIRHHDAV